MTRTAKRLFDRALELPARQRVELAAQLIASVDGPPDADWESAWLAELDRRIEATTTRGAPSAEWSAVRKRVLVRLAKR